jgi:hypothetical protein
MIRLAPLVGAVLSNPDLERYLGFMRKLFSNGLVLVAGVVSLPATSSHADTAKPQSAEIRKHDRRLQSLRNFFRRRNCPAAAVSNAFLEASDANALDWRLLPSISFIESTGGKWARNNNLFGWDSGRAAFSSAIDSIRSVAFTLANSTLYKNKDVDGILRTYNPSADYAGKVKSVMRCIAPTANQD